MESLNEWLERTKTARQAACRAERNGLKRAAAARRRTLRNAQTLPERIRAWVEREFAANRVEEVFAEFIDVATGNRHGNAFVLAALRKIAPENFA